MQVLDAGCGGGRNLIYFLRERYRVFGGDADPLVIAEVRHLASLAPNIPSDHFCVDMIEIMSFPDTFADLIINGAVLHFARNDQPFEAILHGIWRVLKPGGLLFYWLASSIGMERQIQCLAGRRFLLSDGSERYLVDEALLDRLTAELRREIGSDQNHDCAKATQYDHLGSAEESLIRDGKPHQPMLFTERPYRRWPTLWQREPDKGYASTCQKLPHRSVCLLTENEESSAAESLVPGLIACYRDHLRSGDRLQGGSSLALSPAGGACRQVSPPICVRAYRLPQTLNGLSIPQKQP